MALITLCETAPACSQALGRRTVAAIAIGQALRQAATTEQHELLAHGRKTQPFGASGRTIGKHGRAPAAAQQMGLAGVDLADFGKLGILRV